MKWKGKVCSDSVTMSCQVTVPDLSVPVAETVTMVTETGFDPYFTYYGYSFGTDTPWAAVSNTSDRIQNGLPDQIDGNRKYRNWSASS